ncbi:phenylalanine--tRNA ligase subunit beta [Candidatus Bathyarchaeota archaeon]|nr:MAG: phenylalanine--tRNA ligase subunit beta [Candidatus Bathyarchaeota archaeon]
MESLDEQNDSVSIEVKDSNHPDIWSVEGIARALRTNLGIAKPKAPALSGKSDLRVTVDRRLGPIRPYIATSIVRNVKPSENALKSWISLQEKMDLTYGRKRKRASIGFYQADLVKSPLRYTVGNPDDTAFAPLGSTEKMTLREIVEKHPKGIEYGGIISSFKDWPLLTDGDGQVLSLPPIINSNDLGKVSSGTKNILVEVTGTNVDTVGNTLKIVVAALAERGGKIYSCTQTYADKGAKRVVTPDLKSSSKELSVSYANRLLGAAFKPAEMIRSLVRAGHPSRQVSKDTLRVESLCYRIDIMHQVDLVEDIAIALDINKLDPEWPRIWTLGGLTPETDRHETLAEVMIGLGYLELLTYSLTTPEVFVDKMGLEHESYVELMNPKMSTHTAMRSWLLPSLLNLLRDNTHVDYPQKVFEIGPCVVLREGRSETETRYKIAAVTIHTASGFTEIRSCLDTLLSSIGLKFKVEPTTHPSFLEGRTGKVISEEKPLGIVGELHPRIIREWGLSLPIAAFELEIPPTAVS